MKEIRDIVNRVTFEGNNLDCLPYPEIRNALEEHSIVRITGLFDRDEVLSSRRNIEKKFNNCNDRKHDPRDTKAVRGNLQKLQVGAVTLNYADSVPRFLRMLFNPIFADDIYGMRKLFVRLAQFRNLLYGLPIHFAVHGTEQGLWTASRIHQYPRGGGFMAAHRDDVTAAVTKEAGLKLYLQVYLMMSKKGEDFKSGGAFIEYQGQGVDYEEACDVGDVIVYNEQLTHGVADIDPLEPLDMVTFSGRVAAFVTLFRHLTPVSTDVKVLSNIST
jgi:hypothetical protein